MDIILDNIIFNLQKAGGVSVVWYELVSRILKDNDINPRFVDLPNENIFRKTLNLPDSLILKNQYEKFPLKIQRYLSPIIQQTGIFHSSYYRHSNNPKNINITTVHDFTYEFYRKHLPKYIHHNQKRIAVKNSKRVICVSENTKTDFIRFFPEFNPEHIKVIYNGVDENYNPLTDKKNGLLKELIPYDIGEYVLYVGERKSTYKNFALAVKACKLAKMPLVFVGGGIPGKNEEDFLNEILGTNNFKHLSGINNTKLNLIYNYAFCLLYPSVYEGFGIPVLEAQRTGCPVICSDFSSIPEIAGRGAILLKEISANSLAETIKLLNTDYNLREQIIDEGFRNTQRFSWDKCYAETKSLYNEVQQEYF